MVPVQALPFGARCPDTLALLATRRSAAPQTLVAPAPEGAQLDELLRIAARVPDHGKLSPWRFIVLEGSGLSRPGPILRSLAPLAPLNLAVQVVSTCDATRVAQQATEFDEVAAQLAAAGTIVVTKTDLGDAGEALELAWAAAIGTAPRMMTPIALADSMVRTPVAASEAGSAAGRMRWRPCPITMPTVRPRRPS